MSEDLCRDFDNGKCTRGKRCKYSHPKLLVCRDFQNKTCDREKCKFLHVTRDEEEAYDNGEGLPDHINKEDVKHQKTDQPFGGDMYGKRRREDGFNFNMPVAAPTGLMQENEMLKRKITELQQQVMDLRQMNDTLYDQNTKFRSQLRGTVTPQVDPYAKTQSAGFPSAVGAMSRVY